MFLLFIVNWEAIGVFIQALLGLATLFLSIAALRQKEDIKALKEISGKLDAQASNQREHITILAQDYIQRQPAHFNVQFFKQTNATSGALDVIIINNGKTLYLEDENWLSETDISKFKSTRYPNSYISSSSTNMVETFIDKPKEWNPNKFMLYPIIIKPYEKLKIKFKYKAAETTQRGTGSGLNFILRFKDVNGDCFKQQILGAYYNEIYCGPIYKVNAADNQML